MRPAHIYYRQSIVTRSLDYYWHNQYKLIYLEWEYKNARSKSKTLGIAINCFIEEYIVGIYDRRNIVIREKSSSMALKLFTYILNAWINTHTHKNTFWYF